MEDQNQRKSEEISSCYRHTDGKHILQVETTCLFLRIEVE